MIASDISNAASAVAFNASAWAWAAGGGLLLGGAQTGQVLRAFLRRLEYRSSAAVVARAWAASSWDTFSSVSVRPVPVGGHRPDGAVGDPRKSSISSDNLPRTFTVAVSGFGPQTRFLWRRRGWRRRTAPTPAAAPSNTATRSFSTGTTAAPIVSDDRLPPVLQIVQVRHAVRGPGRSVRRCTIFDSPTAARRARTSSAPVPIISRDLGPALPEDLLGGGGPLGGVGDPVQRVDRVQERLVDVDRPVLVAGDRRPDLVERARGVRRGPVHPPNRLGDALDRDAQIAAPPPAAGKLPRR